MNLHEPKVQKLRNVPVSSAKQYRGYSDKF